MHAQTDPVTTRAAQVRSLPAIIQGGMGVAVSHWHLARTVSQAGGLGVISGTGLDRVVAYRLQEGDQGGHIRRVLARFPIPDIAERILSRWYLPDGPAVPGQYRHTPMPDHQLSIESQELLVVANFVEVALAKEGHDGPIGINLLEKIQTPNLASLYGAMLAGVDAVLMGAGIPREIPAALDHMSVHGEASLLLTVAGALPGEQTRLRFAPRDVMGAGPLPTLKRPPFLAIISSDTLAQALLRATDGQIDGFIVEGHVAGGHNAPPRSHSAGLNARGEPIYGPRDAADLDRLRRLERPFWLAGGYGTRDGLARARAAGAQGVQIGTAFAFCEESGLDARLKAQVLAMVANGTVDVYTDPLASPTGFPFKVVRVPGTISDPELSAKRVRICNMGYLRQAYRMADGSVGWRCPAEPVVSFVAKGGDPAATVGRLCICNALIASTGTPVRAPDGGFELPIITAGDGLVRLGADVRLAGGYSATELCRTA